MNSQTVTVTSATVACDGTDPALGHPRVYLTFKPESDRIVCPYCSRIFVLAADAKAGHGH
jgi:uncharacterized Zn-finger protein